MRRIFPIETVDLCFFLLLTVVDLKVVLFDFKSKYMKTFHNIFYSMIQLKFSLQNTVSYIVDLFQMILFKQIVVIQIQFTFKWQSEHLIWLKFGKRIRNVAFLYVCERINSAHCRHQIILFRLELFLVAKFSFLCRKIIFYNSKLFLCLANGIEQIYH